MNVAEQNPVASSRQTLNRNFGDLYIDVRYEEKRVLTDEQLMLLPDIDASHIHFKEWQIRKRSSKKLIAYIEKKNRPLKILEAGCGNGWLTSKLSSIANSKVTGLDINKAEIIQAKRVFKRNNLEFICDSFNPEIFGGTKFDIILFAASIQYFQSLPNVIKNAFDCLAEKGEIHILDTHFYKPQEINGAIKRTENYFKMLGYPAMAAYYFHHPLNDLFQFNYKILANPRSLLNRIWKKAPFYWISINH